MKKGRRERVEEIELVNKESIWVLWEKENYN